MKKSPISKIKGIKNMSARVKADKSYDKAHGIKQYSKKDKALDKKTGVSKAEYKGKDKY